MPKQIKTATIWYKPGKLRTQRPPDYYLHKTDEWLVLPYELKGLTIDQLSRHKPFLVDILTSINERNIDAV